MESTSLPLEVDEEGRPPQGSSTGSGSSSGTGYYGHKNEERFIAQGCKLDGSNSDSESDSGAGSGAGSDFRDKIESIEFV